METPGGLVGYSRQGAAQTHREYEISQPVTKTDRQTDRLTFLLISQSHQVVHFVRTQSSYCHCQFISYYQKQSNKASDALLFTAEENQHMLVVLTVAIAVAVPVNKVLWFLKLLDYISDYVQEKRPKIAMESLSRMNVERFLKILSTNLICELI